MVFYNRRMIVTRPVEIEACIHLGGSLEVVFLRQLFGQVMAILHHDGRLLYFLIESEKRDIKKNNNSVVQPLSYDATYSYFTVKKGGRRRKPKRRYYFFSKLCNKAPVKSQNPFPVPRWSKPLPLLYPPESKLADGGPLGFVEILDAPAGFHWMVVISRLVVKLHVVGIASAELSPTTIKGPPYLIFGDRQTLEKSEKAVSLPSFEFNCLLLILTLVGGGLLLALSFAKCSMNRWCWRSSALVSTHSHASTALLSALCVLVFRGAEH